MPFLEVIAELNSKIQEFNCFLSPECKFEEIDTSRKEIYSDKVRGGWGGWHSPSVDSFGVYILFGVNEENQEDIAVYIGKASQQMMGHRLWVHLKPHRETMDYHKMIGEQKFNFLALSTLSTRSESCRSLASSLEEYLIRGGLESAKLINKIGK